jgi:hypothetical protein
LAANTATDTSSHGSQAGADIDESMTLTTSPLDVYAGTTRHLLFVFVLSSNPNRSAAMDAAVLQFMERLRGNFATDVERHLVVSSQVSEQDVGVKQLTSAGKEAWTSAWTDTDGRAIDFYGFSDLPEARPFVLVRPDGHIGFQGVIDGSARRTDEDSLLLWLKTYL